jgi:hypothetical protein
MADQKLSTTVWLESFATEFKLMSCAFNGPVSYALYSVAFVLLPSGLQTGGSTSTCRVAFGGGQSAASRTWTVPASAAKIDIMQTTLRQSSLEHMSSYMHASERSPDETNPRYLILRSNILQYF